MTTPDGSAESTGPALRNAGILRRLAAAAYDALLLIALLMVAAAIWLPFNGGEAVPAGDPLFRLYLVLVIAAFWIGFWTRGGQTLGMRAWRLQLLMADGTPVGAVAALYRFPLAFIAWGAAGIGLLWMLLDPDGLAAHDRLSRTRVVLVPKD